MRGKLFLAVTLLLTAWIVSAQEYSAPEVKISSEKVNIAGEIFLMHKVEPKQTLFSICKAYGITQEALLEANPSLADGLKAGSSILVPEAARVAVQETVPDAVPDAVQEAVPEETRESARELNQEAVQETAPATEKKEAKWYEKFFGLFKSKNREEQAEETVPTVTVVPVTSILTDSEADTLQQGSRDEERRLVNFDRRNPLKVSLLLPFNASTEPSANYLDFYCGALSALRELKEEGYCVELTVFDTKSSTPLDDGSLEESDVIIGPVHASDISAYAEFARKNRIPIVSPMDSRSALFVKDNPYFFLAPATDSIQLENLVKSLDASSDDNVYVFHNSTLEDDPLVNKVASALNSAGVAFRYEAYNILGGRELGEKLGHQWSENGSYKIVVASVDEAFAPDVVRNLKQITRNNISLKIFCLNELRGFESSIDYDTFYLTNAHFSAPYWIDYADRQTQDFLLKYRALFNTEPTAFSFQGHDLLKYWVKVMYEGVTDLENATSLPFIQGLQVNIKFERPDTESGWQNTATRDIIYSPDFSVTLTKQD